MEVVHCVVTTVLMVVNSRLDVQSMVGAVFVLDAILPQ